jgi:toxin-antitoxin system PIN domain toxin
MRSLLDVNVLIALIDDAHVHHRRAIAWWETEASNGWASCPLTENAVVRIMCNAAYPGGPFKAMDVIHRLDLFILGTNHEFWPDEISLRDSKTFDHTRFTALRITDVYLLGLAVTHGARLVTFDQDIAITLARSAKTTNLLVI